MLDHAGCAENRPEQRDAFAIASNGMDFLLIDSAMGGHLASKPI